MARNCCTITPGYNFTDEQLNHMADPKGITVFLTREKRRKQQWSYKIDAPGGGTDLRSTDRFSTKFSAERSALRQLGAWDGESNRPIARNGVPVVTIKGKDRYITFINRK
jgi:hypothetical protein